MAENISHAIAIPTYNRSDLLEANLLSMLPEIESLGVQVFVSDDSTDQRTRQLIERLGKRYSGFNYRHNHPRLGHDANVRSTLLWPDVSGYVWLLGDGLSVVPGALRAAFGESPREDFVFVSNALRLRPDWPEKLETAEQLSNIVWHLTLTGATLYGPGPRKWASTKAHAKLHRNFPQLSLILGYCEACDWSAKCVRQPVFEVLQQKGESYWTKDSIEVFGHDWCAAIDGYPALFGPEMADRVIRSHAVQTGLFNWRHLLLVRARGGLTGEKLKQFSASLKRAMPARLELAWVIRLVPQRLAKTLVDIWRKLRR